MSRLQNLFLFDHDRKWQYISDMYHSSIQVQATENIHIKDKEQNKKKKHLNIWRKYMSWGKWSLVCMFGQILAMFGKYKLIYSPPIWSGWTGERILTSKVNKCKMKESLYHRWLEDYSSKLQSKHQTSQKHVDPLLCQSSLIFVVQSHTQQKNTKLIFIVYF